MKHPQDEHAMSETEFLTVRELGQRLKVPASWVYDQVRCQSDPLPHYKMGKYLRFRWSEVSAWIERRHRSNAEIARRCATALH